MLISHHRFLSLLKYLSSNCSFFLCTRSTFCCSCQASSHRKNNRFPSPVIFAEPFSLDDCSCIFQAKRHKQQEKCLERMINDSKRPRSEQTAAPASDCHFARGASSRVEVTRSRYKFTGNIKVRVLSRVPFLSSPSLAHTMRLLTIDSNTGSSVHNWSSA